MSIQAAEAEALLREFLEFLEAKGVIGQPQVVQSPEPVVQAPQKALRQTVDVKTAAELMGVSTGTIYTMVRENQLPHVKVRGRILFHRENIELWLRGELLAQYQA